MKRNRREDAGLVVLLLCACVGCNRGASSQALGNEEDGSTATADTAPSDASRTEVNPETIPVAAVSAVAITSAPGAYWQAIPVSATTDQDATVTVNDAAEAQTWEGFGGCFTELGWSYLSTLSQADRDRAMQLLFGPEGARFAWGRIPIGTNDYALARYTLDDTGDDVIPNSAESNRPPADPTLSKFSLARAQQNLIPYIKAAQAAKPDLRFWAIPWTPPVWMKTGYKKNGKSYYNGGKMKADDATLAAYAQYLVATLRAYQGEGINIEVIAPQNEPGYEQTYPSCLWDKDVYAGFIGRYLGPALGSAGLAARIMIGSLDNSADTDIVNAVLADPTAKGYCTVAGVGYDMAVPSKLTALKAAGLSLWISEHKAGNYYWLPGYKLTAPNDDAYAVESWGLIRDAITSLGVTAYNAWNMVLDRAGKNTDPVNVWAQNALLVADSGQLTATPAYYVFRHFSQFVVPGAKVLGTVGGDAVAFKNPDGSLVVILYNPGAAATVTVALAGKKLQLAVPTSGFATLVQP